ncbi:UDP-galactose/UDP-glucose transporter 5B [Dichanthelium oligosanthes]|uniref:UDP-galactose/UDP-glucose transporter 5B n=1 Tax=Dichanthelium oligosanthes TaxID=888268 RepID=A0A1E5URM4_9POAL|nr:UDP-galactose/UDP-glucose transporter 5B [Dichanthelium oligosanthes]
MADAAGVAAPGLPVAAGRDRDRDRDKDDRRRWAARCGFAVLGIMSTLLVYGVLQEKIMRIPYGVEKEFFRYSLFLVFCNRITTSMVSAMVLLASKKSLDPVAPLHKYGVVSISNILTTTCQYEALKYVSFPVQTLAKCAKMIPVMIWGTIIMRKKYGGKDYFFAVIVTLGCSLFILYPASMDVSSFNKDRESTIWGVSLMLGYLGYDFCLLILLLWDLHSVLFQVATASQFFISYTIRTFGALTFATIMTTRQLVSILLSCVWFVHPLSWMQCVGAVIVFGALYTKSFLRSKPQKPAVASPPRGSSPNPPNNS